VGKNYLQGTDILGADAPRCEGLTKWEKAWIFLGIMSSLIEIGLYLKGRRK
jgi:hypothetical protein